MYLAVDVGGTKTLVASFSDAGKLSPPLKFPTAPDYQQFLADLKAQLAKLPEQDWQAAAVAVPGRLDRQRGIVLALGNLPWPNEPIEADIEQLTHCPVMIENDAKLAGLSEAILIKDDFKNVLYVTIGTGIGTAVITDGIINPHFVSSEAGHMLLEHRGKLVRWEDFASGRAIQQQFGKHASDISDPEAWQQIARNLAIGLIDLIATLTPEVIVIGGGVGVHFEKFAAPLEKILKSYQNPMLEIPPIRQAQRSEQAVLYGCFELLKSRHAKPAR